MIKDEKLFSNFFFLNNIEDENGNLLNFPFLLQEMNLGCDLNLKMNYQQLFTSLDIFELEEKKFNEHLQKIKSQLVPFPEIRNVNIFSMSPKIRNE